MNKRLYLRLTALFVAFALMVLCMPIPSLAKVINGKATLAKCYNKDGKFCMAIDLNFVNDPVTYFEIFLSDEGGNVYTRWDNIMENYTSSVKQYVFSRSYANTPEGLYQMNVVACTPYGDSETFSWTVNHKKVASLTFKDTYKVKNPDGTYGQKFRISTANGKGRTYHMELYTKSGSFVTSFEAEGQYDNSIWSETWNYYPDSGLKMQSGTYILKYWVDNGNPKQVTLKITI